MILLLGGTSETKPIAIALAAAGYAVLVSTATDNALDVGDHPKITRRAGRLTQEGMVELVKENEVAIFIDATHPFAIVAHETAQKAASLAGIPYIRYQRPSTQYDSEGILYAESHEQAAASAFSFGKPVLLTTGSRNLLPYAEKSRASGSRVIARVLPHPESLDACKQAGLPSASVIAKRGPFSVDENLEVIRNFNIGVIVTKDSGSSGGVPEKLEAARMAGCRVVMVRKPDGSGTSFDSVPQLVAEVRQRLS
ncbi:MAG: precorrin-6A reductase [Nitrospinae bacterium]|nr:precorrin-6A reductase [Nitrospinota bacterium]